MFQTRDSCRTTLALFCLILIGAALCPHPANAVERALLIGIDDYSKSHFPSLNGAKNDVALMRDILIRRFGFASDNITVLTDSKATHTAIRDAFQRLADATTSDDTVYIHYSGHGSSACDLSGDERYGNDSTWVSYGSRSEVKSRPQPANCSALLTQKQNQSIDWDINQFDVLDDELNAWLGAISRKTHNMVFVSDSCHSGTISRNLDFNPSRGVPHDNRAYPTDLQIQPTVALGGLRIGACRDTEKAGEYFVGEESHGMFTWFWAQALSHSSPNATWQDMVKRTAALLEYQSGGYPRQHPQLEGKLDLPLFGNKALPHAVTVAVTDIKGRKVQLNAGALNGITPGSIFTTPGSAVQVRIESTRATRSTGIASQPIEAGTLLRLASYKPVSSSTKVLVRTEDPKDLSKTKLLRNKLRSHPGVELVESAVNCDLILHMSQPRQDGPLLCQVLSPQEQLYYPQMAGLEVNAVDTWESRVIGIVDRIARMRALLAMTNPPDITSPVTMELVVWKKIAGENGERTFGKTPYSHWGAYDSELSDTALVDPEDKLTVTLINDSTTPYYTYLLDISPEHGVRSIFPLTEKGMESGRIDPGKTLDTADDLVLTTSVPSRNIRLIASRVPLDTSLLEQNGFALQPTTYGGTKSLDDPSWATEMMAIKIAP